MNRNRPDGREAKSAPPKFLFLVTTLIATNIYTIVMAGLPTHDRGWDFAEMGRLTVAALVYGTLFHVLIRYAFPFVREWRRRHKINRR